MTKEIFKVKKLLILGVFLLFTACAHCPREDVVHAIITPFGPMVLKTEKGTYDAENHSLEQFKQFDGWITLEEYEAWKAARDSI